MSSKRLGIILSSIITFLMVFSVGICCFFLIKSDDNMNSKQGIPDMVGTSLNFEGYEIDNRYVKQHMKGEYEFFYNKWIIEDNYEGSPDALVNVPHHYKDMIINGNRLDNTGFSSYRMYVKGLKRGTKIWLMNNNFIGGFYAYINKELVLKYGSHNKTGNATSNGGDDLTLTYVVKDESPIEIVFEVSSSNQGGLTSPARLCVSTLESNPTSPNLTNNIGFVTLGVIFSLFIFSFVINLSIKRKEFSFSILMFPIILITTFSVGVYWRLLTFLKTNHFNYTLEFNLISYTLLIFALFYHLVKTKKIDFSIIHLSFLILSSVTSIILFYVLMGTFYQIIPMMLIVLSLLSFAPLLAKDIKEKKVNIVYLLFISSLTIFATCTFFDLENMMLAGLEQSTSYILFPLIICVIVLYRLATLDKDKKLIHALEIEKKQNQIKADALKSQIKPHFIFNCLSAIQATYKKDPQKGEKLLTDFSIHLRNNVDASTYDTIPFSRELSNILNYIELENARKNKKVDVLLDIGDFEFDLPMLCLQPFVENAFKYSKVEDKENGYIQIKTYKDKKNYNVLISDNGIGFDKSKIKPNSVGIKNAKERLELISKAKVKIESKIGKGTNVIVSFPINKKEKIDADSSC